MAHDGAMHLLRYKSTTGLAAFGKVNAGGLGIQSLGSASWSKSWTTFSPFAIGGDAHLLGYRGGTGEVDIDLLNAAGSGMSTIWTDWWTTGWA